MITFLISALDFIVSRLYAESQKLDAKAQSLSKQMEVLSLRRQDATSQAGRARGIANNIQKFTK